MNLVTKKILLIGSAFTTAVSGTGLIAAIIWQKENWVFLFTAILLMSVILAGAGLAQYAEGSENQCEKQTKLCQ